MTHSVMTLSEARAAFSRGETVTMTRETPLVRDMRSPVMGDTVNGGDKSSVWQYATVRMGFGAMWKAPGTRAWRNVTGDERGTHAMALRCALDVLSGVYDPDADTDESGNALPNGPVCYLPAVPCLVCGEELTTPDSIRSGMGPVCSGKYAAMAERAEAKRAHWQTVSLASADAGPVLTKAREAKASPRVSCPGTCNPLVFCPDCGA
jgi:hypothetical protein